VCEVINDGINGHLTEFFDIKRLIEKVCGTLEGGSAAADLRNEARASAIAQFDYKTVCKPKLLRALHYQ